MHEKHSNLTKQLDAETNDSWINQVLSITYEIHKSFNDSYEVKWIVSEKSKAFDKVWHLGLSFKLRQNIIIGNHINVLTNF